MPRSPGYRHNEDTRAKIQATQLINRLQAHVDADKPLLDASQVNAAKALLAKVLPDLTAVALDAKHDVSDPLADMLKMIAERGASLAVANDGEPE